VSPQHPRLRLYEFLCYSSEGMCYSYIILPYINSTSRHIGCETHVYETHIYETYMHRFHTLCVLVYDWCRVMWCRKIIFPLQNSGRNECGFSKVLYFVYFPIIVPDFYVSRFFFFFWLFLTRMIIPYCPLLTFVYIFFFTHTNIWCETYSTCMSLAPNVDMCIKMYVQIASLLI
jgi:hypothetical protein